MDATTIGSTWQKVCSSSGWRTRIVVIAVRAPVRPPEQNGPLGRRSAARGRARTALVTIPQRLADADAPIPMRLRAVLARLLSEVRETTS